jgi:hypothetical protein
MVLTAGLSCWLKPASAKNIPFAAPSAVRLFAVREFGSDRWRCDRRAMQIEFLCLFCD